MNSNSEISKICIIDFGGQYAHLIASRIRRLGVYTEILSNDENIESLKKFNGIILSGGPASVYEEGAPDISSEIFNLNIPTLGICYGHQLIMKKLGGEVKASELGEFGRAELSLKPNGIITENLSGKEIVWMSHGDEVMRLPEGFEVFGSTDNCKFAGVVNNEKKIIGIQFHPEVTHTQNGNIFFENFIQLSGCKKSWNMKAFLDDKISEIKNSTPFDNNVFLLVSGGVDSTVAYALLSKSLGKKRVRGLLIDTGFMRKKEVETLKKSLKKLGMKLKVEDASKKFYKSLIGITDPEEKRKRIGTLFLDVKNKVKNKEIKNPENWILGQGTIYPDTIESGGTKHSRNIKTHHNRVDEILDLIRMGKIIEPIKELYKDEVRDLGRLLGLPDEFISRHPFPGPGLAVRMITSMGNQNIENYGEIQNYIQKYKKAELSILPIKSVGVQGDSRTYKNCAILNDYTNSWDEYNRVSTEITNSFREVNRVVLQPFNTTLKPFLVNPINLDKKFSDLLREADHIVNKLLFKFGIESEIWQMPVALLPIGLKKDTYSIVLRPVESTEAMTANFYPMKRQYLKKIIETILNIKKISAVLYDITNKPPGTIEWE